MKRLTLLLALSFSAPTLAAAGDPLMTVRGAPLLTDDLRALSPVWKSAKGHWTIQDGALHGEEVTADHHPATYRQALKFQDVVIQFEVQLDGAKSVALSLNDAGGHVARMIIDRKGFQARKDDHDHTGPDEALAFQRVAVPIAAGTWHTVTVEILGDRMLATLDGQSAAGTLSFGRAPLIGTLKTNLGLVVQGGAASFRNLNVWAATPNAAWQDPAASVQGGK